MIPILPIIRSPLPIPRSAFRRLRLSAPIRGPYHPLYRHVPKIKLGVGPRFVHKRAGTNRNALKE